jgi:hypothetical protein
VAQTVNSAVPIEVTTVNAAGFDGYLRTAQEYGHEFPGFAKQVGGAEDHDGVHHIYCVKG